MRAISDTVYKVIEQKNHQLRELLDEEQNLIKRLSDNHLGIFNLRKTIADLHSGLDEMQRLDDRLYGSGPGDKINTLGVDRGPASRENTVQEGKLKSSNH
jgi:hypothetical protein